MHHPTDRIAHTTAFVTPVVEHWLEREIAQWVHSLKDRSDDPSHHERTLLPPCMYVCIDVCMYVCKLFCCCCFVFDCLHTGICLLHTSTGPPIARVAGMTGTLIANQQVDTVCVGITQVRLRRALVISWKQTCLYQSRTHSLNVTHLWKFVICSRKSAISNCSGPS